MIFTTVGTQLPFPRLTDFMVNWAASNVEQSVIQSGASQFLGQKDVYETLSEEQFIRHASNARVIVSHAGIGSILTARDFVCPIIVVPRRAALGEHRNDHQIATARSFEGRKGVYVAWEVEHVASLLAQPLEASTPMAQPKTDDLVQYIKTFINAS